MRSKSNTQHWLLMLAAMFLLAGCQTPFLVFPGKALKGELVVADTFVMAERYKLLKLEVNPKAPYSVILRTTLIDGQLYVDAAPARNWAAYLRENNKVRIALGRQIYNAVATRINDPVITERFLSGREIYRLDPATSTP